jgi:hypothetical protein
VFSWLTSQWNAVLIVFLNCALFNKLCQLPAGSGNFSSPLRPGRLWGPPSLLSNGYQELFPWGYSGRGVKMITHLHLVPKSRMRGAINPLPQYAFMAWCLVKKRTETTLPLPLSLNTKWIAYICVNMWYVFVLYICINIPFHIYFKLLKLLNVSIRKLKVQWYFLKWYQLWMQILTKVKILCLFMYTVFTRLYRILIIFLNLFDCILSLHFHYSKWLGFICKSFLREIIWNLFFSNLRGPFAKFVDSPCYSESELWGCAVTVSFSTYLPWQAMHFLQRSTHFSETWCRLLIISKFLSSELPFHVWKSPKIAWGEIWNEFCFRLGKSGSVEPH